MTTARSPSGPGSPSEVTTSAASRKSSSRVVVVDRHQAGHAGADGGEQAVPRILDDDGAVSRHPQFAQCQQVDVRRRLLVRDHVAREHGDPARGLGAGVTRRQHRPNAGVIGAGHIDWCYEHA